MSIPTPRLLPPSPDSTLTPAQWGILAAIANTVVPSISHVGGNRLLQLPVRPHVYNASVQRVQDLAGEGAGAGAGAGAGDDTSSLVAQYLAESASAEPEFQQHLFRFVAESMPEQSRNGLLFILNALNTRVGALLLTGHTTTLDALPVRDRQQVLLGWTTSRIPLLRQLHRSLTALARLFWLRTSPTLSSLLSHPKVPFNAAPPGAGFEYRFLQIPPASAAEVELIETDVVIVGSGCGGAVVAKTLSEAGLKVLVVEKSYYWPPEYLPLSETEAPVLLFGNGGGHASDDASITVVAGQTWGGGGTVNWSASLQPQGFVRREWAEKFGLPHFTSAAFQADLDAVCERMGVSLTNVEHNKANRALMEGARKLGWAAKPVPQNTGGEVHNDGYCTRGCRSGAKKGPVVTFLPDSARAGATFMEGFDVQEILFDEVEAKDGNRIATGVRGVWTSRDGVGGVAGKDRRKRSVIIKAKRTIVAGGSLYTPLLLQKSGLKNRHIGRHLHLHPVSFVGAVWDEDVKPWEGAILTSVVNEFENLDQAGYGSKLEATTMMPSSFLPLLPWVGGLEFKELAIKFRRMTGYISLARDRYGGSVYPDPVDGRARIAYTPSPYDKAHILAGVVGIAEIMYVEGAREIHVPIPGVEPFIRPAPSPSSNTLVTGAHAPSITDMAFRAWVEKLKKRGLPSPDCGFFSAHQMGTARMGTDVKNSVVDSKGRVWGTQRLYVADTSVFPNASGVNPMITCMGISRGIARGIVQEEEATAGLGAGTCNNERARL